MKILNLKIRNFRGIEELDWALPDKQVFCLIGKGDSTKSTILEAIRYALYPNWNLVFYDTDFYLCEIDEPIVIEVTIGNLIDEFCSLEKVGVKDCVPKVCSPNITVFAKSIESSSNKENP